MNNKQFILINNSFDKLLKTIEKFWTKCEQIKGINYDW